MVGWVEPPRDESAASSAVLHAAAGGLRQLGAHSRTPACSMWPAQLAWALGALGSFMHHATGQRRPNSRQAGKCGLGLQALQVAVAGKGRGAGMRRQEAGRLKLEAAGQAGAGGGGTSEGGAPAVTAGGMLISSRWGSTISAGRSIVSSLVRKACGGGGQARGKRTQFVGRCGGAGAAGGPACACHTCGSALAGTQARQREVWTAHSIGLPAELGSSSAGCGCTAPAAP